MAFTTALLLAGTAISATSQIQQGRAAKAAGEAEGRALEAEGRAAEEAGNVAARAAEEQGKFQEEIANRNADQAIREAEGRRQAASEAAIQRERQGKALKSKQVAGFAKSGVELRGSALSVLVETAQDTEADRLTILREGAIAGASDEFRAGILTAQGRAANLRGMASGRASRASGLSINRASRSRSRAARASGSAAQRSSVLSAVGTGLSGTARALPSLLKAKDKPPDTFVATG